MINYTKYHLSKKEKIYVISSSFIINGIISYLFYDSFIAMLFLSPFNFLYYDYIKKEKTIKRQEQLLIEFKDTLISLKSNLMAGYSIENAILQAVSEMKMLYGMKGIMYLELEYMKQQLQNNQPIEVIVKDFAKRSSLEEVPIIDIGKVVIFFGRDKK